MRTLQVSCPNLSGTCWETRSIQEPDYHCQNGCHWKWAPKDASIRFPNLETLQAWSREPCWLFRWQKSWGPYQVLREGDQNWALGWSSRTQTWPSWTSWNKANYRRALINIILIIILNLLRYNYTYYKSIKVVVLESLMLENFLKFLSWFLLKNSGLIVSNSCPRIQVDFGVFLSYLWLASSSKACSKVGMMVFSK